MQIISGGSYPTPEGSFLKLTIQLGDQDLIAMLFAGEVPETQHDADKWQKSLMYAAETGEPAQNRDLLECMTLTQRYRVLKNRADKYVVDGLYKDGLLTAEQAKEQLTVLANAL
jgi:hypothetical protein